MESECGRKLTDTNPYPNPEQFHSISFNVHHDMHCLRWISRKCHIFVPFAHTRLMIRVSKIEINPCGSASVWMYLCLCVACVQTQMPKSNRTKNHQNKAGSVVGFSWVHMLFRWIYDKSIHNEVWRACIDCIVDCSSCAFSSVQICIAPSVSSEIWTKRVFKIVLQIVRV